MEEGDADEFMLSSIELDDIFADDSSGSAQSEGENMNNPYQFLCYLNSVLFLLIAENNLGAESDADNKFQSILNDAFCHYLRFNESFRALENMMRIIDRASEKYRFPSTKHLILKHIDSQIQVTYFVLCPSCKMYTENCAKKNDFVKCTECQSMLKADETNFFVYLKLEDQLKQELHKHKQHVIKFYKGLNDKPNWNNADFSSGSAFKGIKKEMGTHFPLPLQVNTDGISVRSSNRRSLWPILLIQNYLPPSIRYLRKNVILTGLYYGDAKPDMSEFFLPLAMEMNKLEEKKIELRIDNVRVEFEPVISSCCVDLPAKAALQKLVQYNGYHACSFCHHPGISVVNPNFKNRSFVRYVNGQDCLPRSHGETLVSMNSIQSNGAQSSNGNDGVKGLSCMVAFSYFDIIESFDLDYMHNSLLGVGLLLFDLWTNTKNKKERFYITPSNKIELNSNILSIRPCSFISRRPRGLDKNISYKANEIRSLILYYLPVCLKGILSHEHYEHFMLLASSIHALLKTNITENSLNECEIKLSEFVKLFEKHYGSHNMVMNVHLLSHVVQCVRRLGPLWAQSAFAFENFNGQLANYVIGPTDTLLQVTTKYVLSKMISQHVDRGRGTSDFNQLLGRATMFTVQDQDEIRALKESGIQRPTILIMKRYRDGNGIIYTSSIYLKAKKTIDYFIQSDDGRLGVIKYFFKYWGQNYIMLRLYNEIQRFYHITEVIQDEKCAVIPVTNIIEKKIYVKVHAREYVTFEPNAFERE